MADINDVVYYFMIKYRNKLINSDTKKNILYLHIFPNVYILDDRM